MKETANEKNNELLRLAKRRVFLKKTVKWHAIIFLIVNVFLCVIYYLTTPGGYFWPLWSIAGWGVGLVIHAVVVGSVLSSTRSREDSVEKEYQMLKKDLDQTINE